MGEQSVRIGFCGEINSGKSTALQAVLRQAFLPDFFGAAHRPVIRVTLGAEADKIVMIDAEGGETEVASGQDVDPDENLAEIAIYRKHTFGLCACELIEPPALRDGHIDDDDVALLESFDILVWTTIGSQAWRLSEKNILDELSDRLPKRRILIATRADKFRSDEDREKLRDRLERETSTYFTAGRLLGVAPALLDDGGDGAAWEDAGVEDFARVLSKTVTDLRENHDEDYSAQVDVVEVEENQPLETHLAIKRPRAGTARRFSTPPEEEPFTPIEVPEASAVETRAALESAERLTEAVEQLTAQEGTEDENPMAEFADSLNGVVALGAVDLSDSENVDRLFGSEEKTKEFASFCALSARTMQQIAGFGGMDPDPESEQITLSKHNIIYRMKDGKVLFLASETDRMSTGIARTAFQRLVHLYDTEERKIPAAA